MAGAVSLPWIDGLAAGGTVIRDPKQNRNYKKSVMWGTVLLEGSVPDKCKAIKSAGFEGVEMMSHLDRQEVLSAVKDSGLEISGVYNAKHWDFMFSDPDASVREQGIEAMIVALEDAKAYGVDCVLLVPGRVNETVSYDQCWERSVAAIRRVVPVAEKLKVKIAIENVWNNFLLSPMEAANYVDQFKSPSVGFYLDCGNIVNTGWPEQWIDILGKRIVRIHVKEFSRTLAATNGKNAGFNVSLLDGDNNWPVVMDAIRRQYKEAWLTAEQGGGDSIQGLTDIAERMEKIINI